MLLFIFPIGAFVEPDEEEMKSMARWERMRLYSAGPGSNMVIAIVFSLLFSWGMVASLEPSNDGVLSASVVVDYGGEEADCGDFVVAFQRLPIQGVDIGKNMGVRTSRCLDCP